MDCLWTEGVGCKEYLINSGHYIWISFGILLCFAELLIPGVFIVFVGLGAIFTGFVVLFAPLSFGFQIMIWTVSSVLIILAGGQFMKTLFPSDKKYEPTMENDFAGKTAVVTETIPEKGEGRISFQGTEWEAVSISGAIEKGTTVRIFERNNLTFTVAPLEKSGA